LRQSFAVNRRLRLIDPYCPETAGHVWSWRRPGATRPRPHYRQTAGQTLAFPGSLEGMLCEIHIAVYRFSFRNAIRLWRAGPHGSSHRKEGQDRSWDFLTFSQAMAVGKSTVEIVGVDRSMYHAEGGCEETFAHISSVDRSQLEARDVQHHTGTTKRCT
jgi:hypothetical protein